MKRARSRWLSLTLTVMLVVSMSPVGTASGSMVAGGESGEAGAKTPTVSTSASQGGIRIKVRDLPREVQSFDVYRSESVLVEGTKLNTMPVMGRTFMDSTAQAGVQYYYTVKIAARGEGPKVASAGSLGVGDALPQVKADVAKARPVKKMASASVATSGDKKKVDGSAAASIDDAPAATAQAISQMSVTTGTASAVTTLAASATWSPAAGPYFIRGDLVVPVGKTLTILPGTKVYFDTEPAGSAAGTRSPVPGVQDVTPKIDLVVHGKLIAKGTSTNPILFSSINSTVESSSAGANMADNGDWGCIFVDSDAASEVSYATFEYGRYGVWAHNTLRPYISNCTFRSTGIDTQVNFFPWGAINFTNPPKATTTTPRIRITNNSIDAVAQGEGINVIYKALGTGTLDRVVDPYIAYNDIRGFYGICLQADENPYVAHGGQVGTTIVKGTLVGNKVRSVWDTVYGYSDSAGDKSGTWMPAFSGNTLISDYSNAVSVNQDAMGVGGDSYVKPTFYKDVLTGVGSVYLDVASNSSTVPTSVGDARLTPAFTSCTIKSQGGIAVALNSAAQASGAAISDPVFTGGRVEVTDHEGVYAYSAANLGAASSSPSFSGVTGRNWQGDYDFLSCDSSSNEGNVKANPRWVGGSIMCADDDGIYTYAYASKGSAEAKPYVSDTEIVAEDYCVDAEAYAAQDVPTGAGNANASGTVRNSRLVSNEYDAYYGEADTNGTGSAACSPAFTNADLTAEDYYATELYAQAVGGAVTCSPVFTDTSSWSYDGNYIDVERSGDGTKSADVNVAPKMSNSVLFAKYDDAFYMDADNNGVGNCFVKPSFTYSDIINSYDYEALDAYADVATTGTAECSPVAVGSNFVGDYGAIYTEANGAGDGSHSVAKANGTFTDCSFSAAWDDAVYNYAEALSGDAEVKPTYTRCIAESHDNYAYEFESYAYGDPAKATAAPTVSGGRIPDSAYGIDVRAYSYDPASEGTWAVAPRILNVPITAHDDYGIYTWAMTWGVGTAVNNSYVYNSPTTSAYGVIHEARGNNGSPADVTNNSKTHGVSTAKRMAITSAFGTGVYTDAMSDMGSAVDRSEMKYLAVSANLDAFWTEADANSGATETAIAAPVITGNVNDTGWGAEGYGAYVSAYAPGVASTATASPSITSNSLSSLAGYDGIRVYSNSAMPALGPVISGNTLRADADGIYVAGNASDSTGTATITKNTIANPKEAGITVDGLPVGRVEQNRIVNPGWGYDGPAVNSEASGIVWNYADPSKGVVRGNLVAGARGAGVYYPNGAAKTNFNSFGNCAGNLNRPFNYWTDQPDTSSETPFDATRNWWGTAEAASILRTINTPSFSGNATEIVNAGLPLTSCQPKVTSLVAAKTSTKVTFTVRFDRAMDPAIRTLYFGKSSPYRSYKVTGTWYKDAAGNYTTFKGTRARSGLPTGVKLYFSGAKDLPGNPMLSTSKYVKL